MFRFTNNIPKIDSLCFRKKNSSPISYILQNFVVTLSYEFSLPGLWVITVFDPLENNIKFIFPVVICDSVSKYSLVTASLSNIISFDMSSVWWQGTRWIARVSRILRCLRSHLVFWELCKISRYTGKHVKGQRKPHPKHFSSCALFNTFYSQLIKLH